MYLVNIWIRITKVGGTSFSNAIKTKNLPIKTFTITKENVNNFKQLELKDSFTFSIIRNPYEKGLSSYKWLTVGNGSKRFKKLNAFNSGITYEDFLKRSIELRNDYEKYNHTMLDSGVIIPNNYMGHKEGNIEYEYFWVVQHLEGLYNTITTFVPLDKLDLIIKLENFNDEKIKLEDVIGKTINMPHLNKTRSDRSFEVYTDKVMIPFMELYKNDIKHFDYEL